MRRGLLAFVVAILCGCSSPTGPSAVIDIRGDWQTAYFGFTCCVYWNLRISVEDGHWTGKACLTSSGQLTRDDIPVTVEGGDKRSPLRVTFVTDDGGHWVGAVTDRGFQLAPAGVNPGSRGVLSHGGDYCGYAR